MRLTGTDSYDYERFAEESVAAHEAILTAEEELAAFLKYARAAALGEHYAVEVERRREAIQAAVEYKAALRDDRARHRAFAVDPAAWPTLEIEEQREIARALIERVVIRSGGKGAGRWVQGLAIIDLGISISLDELSIGLSLGLLGLPLPVAVVFLGIQAFVAAQLGLWLGSRLDEELREGAERLAGLLLIATAVALVALQLTGHTL